MSVPMKLLIMQPFNFFSLYTVPFPYLLIFQTWLSEYIKVVTTDSDGVVDLDATREALLSQLPSSREESDTFWSHVEDETKAEIFLQTLLAQGDSQAVDGKTESDGKALDDLKTF